MNGKELKDLRRKAGLKQVELANEFDIDDQTICNWESRNVNLRLIYSTAFQQLFDNPERIAAIIGSRKNRRFQSRSERRRIALQKDKIDLS
jgi:DNA-binding XRE family transcriptional regulator